MKHLILLRHANTETAAVGQKDFDRALTAQGRHEATEMSKRLLAAQSIPNQIICSAAKRAHTTATLIAMALQLDDQKLLVDQRIYSAGVAELLTVIHTAPPCERLLLVGHNPTISELSDQLAHTIRVPALPTCGMVAMSFEIDNWSEVDFYNGVNVVVDSPANSRR